MKENTIVTLVMSNNGAEIIGKFIADDFNSITLYKPRLVQATAQGIGIYDGLCLTGKSPEENFDFPKTSVLYMVETVEELAKGWQSQTSGIALPPKGIV